MEMTIRKIKIRMETFTDFYGGDMLDIEEIRSATTKEELANIIERHRSHMESMLADANSHLDSFKEQLGLNFY